MLTHHLEPLSVFLVKRGGSGDRILFRFPYSEPKVKIKEEKITDDRNPNPYCLGTLNQEDLLPEDSARIQDSSNPLERLCESNIIAFPSRVLSNLFAANHQLCNGAKFELKVDDVRFVGHPTTLEMKPEEALLYSRYRGGNDPAGGVLSMFNVVFALSTEATFSVVKCFHELTEQLAIAIRYEERRSGYLLDQTQIMMKIQDNLQADQDGEKHVSRFAMALEASQLARDLKKVYEDLCQTGYVEVRINRWSEILFCLPQKVHKKVNPNLLVEPESIYQCMKHLRPFHALLLLQDEQELVNELPLDYNTAVKKVLLQASPLKNFRVLAADTDLTKLFVFQIGMQLLYWGKATVIYPLCNTNIYVVSPNVPNPLSPILLDKFADQFPGLSLAEHLEMFSLPTSITQALPSVSRQDEYHLLARVIVWCLQHHILIQLHTYITLAVNDECINRFPDPFLEDSAQENTRNADNIHQLDFESETSQLQRYDSDQPPLSLPEVDSNSNYRWKRLKFMKSVDEILSNFNDVEKAEIKKIPASENLDDLRLFVRLVPYFNGNYHLEEIMYHENVRRSHLLQLMDKFRSILITHNQEDTNVTMYFNASMRTQP